jgi:hypothetical protein
MISEDQTSFFSRESYLTTPYSFRETMGWFKRLVFGPTKNNSFNIEYMPKSHMLNKITPKFTISFIGDIMDIKFRDLIIHENIKDFVKGSDFLIGNFEGTLTPEKRFMNKRHKPQIMDALESLFQPNKTYLSVANNHSGDFGSKIFSHSVKQLERRGFNVFGSLEKPYCDLTDDLRVIGGTQWSNRPCNYLVKLKDTINYTKRDSCNLLFPHWGYERELYPRMDTIREGMLFLSEFDLLIGHHSHTPQPVSFYNIDGVNKLTAYSLGNFCFGMDNKKFKDYKYGIAIKTEIGINEVGQWSIGKVKWTFLKSYPISKKEAIVETADNYSNYSLDYGDNTLYI